MSSVDLRTLVNDWCHRSWSIVALGVMAERGLLDRLRDGPKSLNELARIASVRVETMTALTDVLAAHGVVSVTSDQVSAAPMLSAWLETGDTLALAADLRSTVGVAHDALAAAEGVGTEIEGWKAVDPVTVRAQGIVSHAMGEDMSRAMRNMPMMNNALSKPGARFLDVGAGAMGTCIALAKHYPNLRCVGLEPVETARHEAERAMLASGIQDRLELRPIRGEQITEENAYAVAYVAQMFIPDAAVLLVLQATQRALEPSGVLFSAAISGEGAELPAAVSRLRNAIWGGGVRTPQAVESLLTQAGFVDIRFAPAPPGATFRPLVARKPG